MDNVNHKIKSVAWDSVCMGASRDAWDQINDGIRVYHWLMFDNLKGDKPKPSKW